MIAVDENPLLSLCAGNRRFIVSTNGAILESLRIKREFPQGELTDYCFEQDLIESAVEFLFEHGVCFEGKWVAVAQSIGMDTNTTNLLKTFLANNMGISETAVAIPKKSDFTRRNGKLVWKSNGKAVAQAVLDLITGKNRKKDKPAKAVAGEWDGKKGAKKKKQLDYVNLLVRNATGKAQSPASREQTLKAMGKPNPDNISIMNKAVDDRLVSINRLLDDAHNTKVAKNDDRARSIVSTSMSTARSVNTALDLISDWADKNKYAQGAQDIKGKINAAREELKTKFKTDDPFTIKEPGSSDAERFAAFQHNKGSLGTLGAGILSMR
jgi:hypothetical protein